MSNQDDIEALMEIMRRLRDPEGGCPWDIEQDFKTIAPYTVEEAYEVADAIDAGDMDRLKDELGDLLFQVVYHAQMAKEQASFDFDDVTRGISAKMISRHPHVFGDKVIETADAQTEAWETRKAEERAAKGEERTSALDDVPLGLPSLLRAEKLQKRAARVGFDWTDISSVTDKVLEEIGEVSEEIAAGKGQVTEELKDESRSCRPLWTVWSVRRARFWYWPRVSDSGGAARTAVRLGVDFVMGGSSDPEVPEARSVHDVL